MARRSRNRVSYVCSRTAISEHICRVVILKYLERNCTRRATHSVHVVAKEHPPHVVSAVALATAPAYTCQALRTRAHRSIIIAPALKLARTTNVTSPPTQANIASLPLNILMSLVAQEPQHGGVTVPDFILN